MKRNNSKKGSGRKKNASSLKSIECKAARILSAGDQIKCIGSGRWGVRSKPEGQEYVVSLSENGCTCKCFYHVNRKGARCKHIVAVEMLLVSQANVQDAGEPMTLDKPDVRCPNCKSVKFCKNGNRYHKHRDPTQTFKCRKCNRRFTGKPGFEHRRHDPSMIIFCLMAFGFGISPNNISLMFANCGNRVHPATVARWATHYAGLVERYATTLRPSAGYRWSADEKYKRVSGKECWLFSVIDTATRFVLSWETSTGKMNYDAAGLLDKARLATGFRPRVFVTDGLCPFRKAFKKIFWSGRGPRPVHVADCHWMKKYCSNNGHERFNGELGDVLKGVRGIKKCESPLFKLLIVHHNFIKPHLGLGGMTPAKAAGITIKGPPWRTLIACAAVHETLAVA